MRDPLRRAVHRGLELTGLIGPLHRRKERELVHSFASENVDDQRPMPPAELIVLVAGASGHAWFSERGRADAERFLALAAKHGLSGPHGAPPPWVPFR